MSSSKQNSSDDYHIYMQDKAGAFSGKAREQERLELGGVQCLSFRYKTRAWHQVSAPVFAALLFSSV